MPPLQDVSQWNTYNTNSSTGLIDDVPDDERIADVLQYESRFMNDEDLTERVELSFRDRSDDDTTIFNFKSDEPLETMRRKQRQLHPHKAHPPPKEVLLQCDNDHPPPRHQKTKSESLFCKVVDDMCCWFMDMLLCHNDDEGIIHHEKRDDCAGSGASHCLTGTTVSGWKSNDDVSLSAAAAGLRRSDYDYRDTSLASSRKKTSSLTASSIHEKQFVSEMNVVFDNESTTTTTDVSSLSNDLSSLYDKNRHVSSIFRPQCHNAKECTATGLVPTWTCVSDKRPKRKEPPYQKRTSSSAAMDTTAYYYNEIHNAASCVPPTKCFEAHSTVKEQAISQCHDNVTRDDDMTARSQPGTSMSHLPRSFIITKDESSLSPPSSSSSTINILEQLRQSSKSRPEHVIIVTECLKKNKRRRKEEVDVCDAIVGVRRSKVREDDILQQKCREEIIIRAARYVKTVCLSNSTKYC